VRIWLCGKCGNPPSHTGMNSDRPSGSDRSPSASQEGIASDWVSQTIAPARHLAQLLPLMGREDCKSRPPGRRRHAGRGVSIRPGVCGTGAVSAVRLLPLPNWPPVRHQSWSRESALILTGRLRQPRLMTHVAAGVADEDEPDRPAAAVCLVACRQMSPPHDTWPPQTSSQSPSPELSINASVADAGRRYSSQMNCSWLWHQPDPRLRIGYRPALVWPLPRRTGSSSLSSVAPFVRLPSTIAPG
jgi:hypothetical protein